MRLRESLEEVGTNSSPSCIFLLFCTGFWFGNKLAPTLLIVVVCFCFVFPVLDFGLGLELRLFRAIGFLGQLASNWFRG